MNKLYFLKENFKNFINIASLEPLETNCYYFINNEKIFIIDPASNSDHLIEFLNKNKNLKKYIILTHNHIDHINGVSYLKKKFDDIKIIMHKDDAKTYNNEIYNGSVFLGEFFNLFDIDIILENEIEKNNIFEFILNYLKNYLIYIFEIERINLKDFLNNIDDLIKDNFFNNEKEIIKEILDCGINFYKIENVDNIIFFNTKGHTEGSISIIFANIIFSGDTIFKEGFGRTDLPGGNEDKLKNSLASYFKLKEDYIKILLKILKILDIRFEINFDFLILPGHGEETLLENEKDFLKEYLNL